MRDVRCASYIPPPPFQTHCNVAFFSDGKKITKNVSWSQDKNSEISWPIAWRKLNKCATNRGKKQQNLKVGRRKVSQNLVSQSREKKSWNFLSKAGGKVANFVRLSNNQGVVCFKILRHSFPNFFKNWSKIENLNIKKIVNCDKWSPKKINFA